MEAPCGKCERKGCGSYHDICEKYMEYKRESEKKRELIMQELIASDFENVRMRSMKNNRNSNGIGRVHMK